MNLGDRWPCKVKASREYSKEGWLWVPRGRWLGCQKASRTGSQDLRECFGGKHIKRSLHVGRTCCQTCFYSNWLTGLQAPSAMFSAAATQAIKKTEKGQHSHP